MKILFLSDDFPPNSFGGAGVIAYNLAKEFLSCGHEVIIITTVQEKLCEGHEIIEGINIFKIYSNYNKRWRAWLSLYNPKTVKKVKRIIKQIKPDIVHVHNIHYHLSYACLRSAKKYSKAVFLTAHDVMLVHYGKLMFTHKNFHEDRPKNYKISILDQIKEAGKGYNPFRNLIIRHYLKYIDRIFVVSNALKKVLEINGIKNIEVIHNGIDIENWKANEETINKFKSEYRLNNKKVILFSGRISEAKGINTILRTMKLIINKDNNVILLIVGKSDQKTIELTKELEIDSRIIFADWLDRESIKLAYLVADVCVIPSICFDSFPNTNLEAMACSKPVVGTCFGGTPEIVVDNQTGYIVDPENTEKLSDKIIDLLKNPQKAKQFGENGYERVKKYFSLQEQANKIIKNYNQYI
ncbi:MAG TPA: glycosyltransferase family 4 protein [Candidatus Portnoybacteria bacterium]|nr:glycosyltransferase family 4 protein [Candidatus Portnoybacteria bacterium]